MLYGGPLGTYLSGLSSSSSTAANPNYTSPTSPHSTSSYSGSGYLGSGLRRSKSRYRPGSGSAGSGSTGIGSTGGTSLSNYYTPQVRRKYGSTEADPVKSVNRYSTRPTTKSSLSPSSSTSPSAASSSNVFHFSRWSPNKSPNTSTGYGKTSLGTSASWNSDLSAVASGSVDYKKLYETEKVATDELRNEVDLAQKEMNELKAKIDSALQTRRVSGAEKRKMERRISECEEELKLLDKLRAESEKLRAEHRALVRVVSRLNRER